MRVKKLKRTRRNIKYYCVHYNFHEPFKILLDGNFIYTMQKLKLGDIGEAMKNLLGTKRSRIFVPYCVLSELNKMRTKCISSLKSQRKKRRQEKEGIATGKRKRDNDDENQEIQDNSESEDNGDVQQSKDVDSLKEELKVYKLCMDQIKKLPKHKCGHEEKNICPTQCIPQQLGSDNPSLWWIATQDENLQKQVHQMKGVPLITCGFNGIRLEPPSEACKTQADDEISKNMDVAEWEKDTDMLRNHFQGRSRGKSKGWRRNKPKGPNPLSIKKKKVKTGQIQNDSNDAENQPKRKRARRKKQTDDVDNEQ